MGHKVNLIVKLKQKINVNEYINNKYVFIKKYIYIYTLIYLKQIYHHPCLSPDHVLGSLNVLLQILSLNNLVFPEMQTGILGLLSNFSFSRPRLWRRPNWLSRLRHLWPTHPWSLRPKRTPEFLLLRRSPGLPGLSWSLQGWTLGLKSLHLQILRSGYGLGCNLSYLL